MPAHNSHRLSACLGVSRLILQGNRQSDSQPEHDLESETTRQGTKCVTWAQSFSLSLKTERQRQREGGTGGGSEKEREGFYQPAALRS